MTMILPRVETRPASPIHHASAAIRRLIAAAADIRRRWQTQRMLDSMPMEMRKDLGWPAVDDGLDQR